MPGTRDKQNSIRLEPFLELLADELTSLSVNGVTVYDSFAKEPINVRAFLLTIGGDYRGIEEILRIRGAPHALHACYRCWLKAVKGPRKNLYGGAFRYLHMDDSTRALLCKLNNPEKTANGHETAAAPRTQLELAGMCTAPPADKSMVVSSI